MSRNFYTLFAIATSVILLLLLTAFGEKGGFFLSALLTGALALLLLGRYQRPILGLAIILLGTAPWYWGVDIGALPKVFADEGLFLLYGGYLMLAFIGLKQKPFFTGEPLVTAALLTMIGIQSLSFFFNDTSYIAVRNYLETYVFGALLYFIFLNETNENNLDFITNAIVLTAAVLALGMIVEWAVSYNPIMAHAKDTLYLSPELSRITGNVYRPYATFFHPSEGGTFLAMCLPFVYSKAMTSRKLWGWQTLLVVLVLGAIVINYTRGVWLAVGLSAFIFIRPLRRPLLYLTLPAIGFGVLITAAYQDLPFVRRLFDPSNLLARTFYWDVALDVFKQSPLIGIGHMNFKNVYLDFVRNLAPGVQFDVYQVFVADSTYLSTLVEFGLLGLASIAGFWCIAIGRLRRLYVRLTVQPNEAYRNLALCCMQGISIYILAGLLADVHQFTKTTKLVFILLGIGFSTARVYLPIPAEIRKIASSPQDRHPENQL